MSKASDRKAQNIGVVKRVLKSGAPYTRQSLMTKFGVSVSMVQIYLREARKQLADEGIEIPKAVPKVTKLEKIAEDLPPDVTSQRLFDEICSKMEKLQWRPNAKSNIALARKYKVTRAELIAHAIAASQYMSPSVEDVKRDVLIGSRTLLVNAVGRKNAKDMKAAADVLLKASGLDQTTTNVNIGVADKTPEGAKAAFAKIFGNKSKKD